MASVSERAGAPGPLACVPVCLSMSVTREVPGVSNEYEDHSVTGLHADADVGDDF